MGRLRPRRGVAGIRLTPRTNKKRKASRESQHWILQGPRAESELNGQLLAFSWVAKPAKRLLDDAARDCGGLVQSVAIDLSCSCPVLWVAVEGVAFTADACLLGLDSPLEAHRIGQWL